MNKRTLTYVFIAGLAAASGAAAPTASRTPTRRPRRRAERPRSTAASPPTRSSRSRRPTASSRDRDQGPRRALAGRVWQALEHGEKVDCLDCIPAVEKLLYDERRQDARDLGLVAAPPHLRRVRRGRGLRADDPDAANACRRDDARPRGRSARRVPFVGGGVAPVATALVKRRVAAGPRGSGARARPAEQRRPEQRARAGAVRRR